MLAITADALIRRNPPLLKGVGHFGAGSFHTKKFLADFIRLNWNFIHKNDKFAF